MKNAALFLLLLSSGTASATPPGETAVPYLQLSQPRQVLAEAQAWEDQQFPHTMSVLERRSGGYRYWGWYGLENGRGIGLARSNDLLHWNKYPGNPLQTNARWPSVLDHVEREHPETVYLAFCRNFDPPSGDAVNTADNNVVRISNSYIVLAKSTDGIHITQVKTLVEPMPDQHNQNPDLFRDPSSGRYYLTFYRGNEKDQFAIISRNAAAPEGLSEASEKVLLYSTETIAAPNLLYVAPPPGAGRKEVRSAGASGSSDAARSDGRHSGVYYLAIEIYPYRDTDNPAGEWQVKILTGDAPDGRFRPVAGDPIALRGQRACLFQHIFGNRFYGYACHKATGEQWILEEVEAVLP